MTKVQLRSAMIKAARKGGENWACRALKEQMKSSQESVFAEEMYEAIPLRLHKEQDKLDPGQQWGRAFEQAFRDGALSRCRCLRAARRH